MKTRIQTRAAANLIALSTAMPVCGVFAAEKFDKNPQCQLPRPDNKTPDQTNKVKVFILMGQSNMVGMGDINPETKPGTFTTSPRRRSSIHNAETYMEVGLRLGWAMAELLHKQSK